MQNQAHALTAIKLAAITALAAIVVSVFGCRMATTTNNTQVQFAKPPTATATPDPAVIPQPCRRDNGKYGYCANGEYGTLVISAVYDEANYFTLENLAAVKMNGRWGYIDRTGSFAIPIQFDEAAKFSEELAAVKQDGKFGYIDRTGKTVINREYDYAEPFAQGLAAVGANNKRGYVNQTGLVVIALKYTEAYGFNNGLADVAANDKHGFVDRTGSEIVPPKYDSRIYSHTFAHQPEGLVRACLNGKWGFINRRGTAVIPFVYEAVVSGFSSKLAAVRLNNKYGYIDATGKTVVEFKYDEAAEFSGQYARVTVNGEKIAVDRTGKEYDIHPNHHQDTYTPRN